LTHFLGTCNSGAFGDDRSSFVGNFPSRGESGVNILGLLLATRPIIYGVVENIRREELFSSIVLHVFVITVLREPILRLFFRLPIRIFALGLALDGLAGNGVLVFLLGFNDLVHDLRL